MSIKPGWSSFLSGLQIQLMGLVLLAVVPALGLILYTAAAQRGEATLTAQQSLLRLTRLVAADQKQLTETTRQLLVTLAQLPEVRSGNRKSCNRLLANLKKEFPNYVGFGVSAPNGSLQCSSLPITKPINNRDLLFFRLVQETKRFAVGDYQIGKLSRRATIGFGNPVLDQKGQLQAVVSAGLDLERLNQFAQITQLQEGATLVVVDRNSTILLRYPDPGHWIGESYPDAQINRIVLNQAEGTAQLRGTDDIERLYAFSRLGNDPVNRAISIRISIPKSIAVAPANRLLSQNLMNLGLVTLLALAAAWVGGNLLLVRKVKLLVGTTEQLSQGDLTVRTAIAADAGELGQLARSFNDMAAALEQRDQEIDKLNRDLQQTLTIKLQTTQQQAEADRRTSEARYRLLAEAIPQFVWMTNAAGQNEYVNQRFCDYAGLTYGEMANLGWLNIVHPDDLEMTRQCWLAAVNSGELYEIEYRFRRADGVYRWFLGQGIPLKDEQGCIYQWVGTCTDIEPQKQVEQARLRLLAQEQTARETAEQANRIKDEFLAVLSHELRTPMNPILGWSKLLLGGKLDATKTDQAIKTIHRNAQLQVQLIDDLLDISRILRGKLSLNSTPVDLSNVIAMAIATVRLAAEAKSIAIKPTFSPSTIVVNGDAGRLQQVIWNLLSNAVKFTPASGQVEIELSQVGMNAQIQVKDSGKGISPDFLPYVFEHFRQEDGATTRQFGGLGLGLAIARQIVEMHGGRISVKSLGADRGATFEVQLPLLGGRESAIARQEQAQETLPTANPLTGLRILVVEDETDSRDFIRFVLEQAGAMVISAASGTEAFQKLEQVTFNLIVSDIGMPEMDGYMLMQQVRKLPPEQNGQVKAIALTAYAGDFDQQQALQAGFEQHISKPVEPDVLVEAIAELISPLR